MMERTAAVPGQDQEHRRASHWNEVEWQQDDKFNDLSQRERCIDCAGGWYAEATWRVTGFGIYYPRNKHKLLLTFIHQDRVEYIHQRLIHKECLEQGGDYGRAFTQHQECAVHPGTDTLEDGQEGHLWQICEEKEQNVDEAREEDNRKEAGLEQGPEETMRREIVDALVGKVSAQSRRIKSAQHIL